MAPIKVEGDRSGKHGLCERLLEKLEIYQDNGHFDEHAQLQIFLFLVIQSYYQPW